MRPSFLWIKVNTTKLTFTTCISPSVFQSKVLHRLYPATPELEKKPSLPPSPENLTKKACVNRKTLKSGPVVGKIPITIITTISKHTVHWELLQSRGFGFLFLSQKIKRRHKVWLILAGVSTQCCLLRQTTRHMQKNLSSSSRQAVLIVTRTQVVRRLWLEVFSFFCFFVFI